MICNIIVRKIEEVLFMQSLKKNLLISIVILAAFVLPGCFGSGGLISFLIDFEGLITGTIYHVTDTIVESGVDMTFDTFYWSSGIPTNAGYCLVQNLGTAGFIGNELFLNNINLNFDFHVSVGEITLLAGYLGGNVNLWANGVLENQTDVWLLNGKNVGGALVQVTVLSPTTVQIKISGIINSFAVGGQEFYIDHVFAQ